MKISELKEFRKVNRPTKELVNGKRVYEEIEFEIKYDPNIKNSSYRLFAKIVDISIGIGLLSFLISNNLVELKSTIYFLPLFLILQNSILESVFGSSIGKLIFWIEVVNDECRHVNLLKSFERNIYSFLLIFSIPFLKGNIISTIIDYYDRKMKEKFFYVISKRNKRKILKMLN